VVPFEDSLRGDDVSLRPVTNGVEIVALTIDDELTKTDVEVSRPDDDVKLRPPIVVDSLLANNVDNGDSLLTLTIRLVAISLTFEPNALDVIKPEIGLVAISLTFDVTKPEMDDVSNPDVELKVAVV